MDYYYHPFTGPYSQPPVPSNVIVTVPVSDANIDIGTSTKRYRTLYAVDVGNTRITHVNELVGSPSTSVNNNLACFVDTSGKVIGDSAIASGAVVTNTGTSTSDNLATFSSTSGRAIQDSTLPVATVVRNAATAVSGNLAAFSSGTGNAIADAGLAPANVVTNTGTSTTDNLATFSSTSGKAIQDSTVPVANLVTNTSASTTGNVASFSSTSGRAIQDSAINISNLITNTTPSVSGNFATFLGVSGRAIRDSLFSPSSFCRNIFSLSPTEPITVENSVAQLSLLHAPLASAVGLGSLLFPANSTTAGTSLKIRGTSRGDIEIGTTVSFTISFIDTVAPATYDFTWPYTCPATETGVTWSHDMLVHLTNGTIVLSWVLVNPTGAVQYIHAAQGGWPCASINNIDFLVQFDAASMGNKMVQRMFLVEQNF